MEMEHVKETKFKFLKNKLVIIAEIPVQGNEDNFKVTNIVTMPVKFNDEFYRIKNVEGRIAVGNLFRTRITNCQEQKHTLFCKSNSEYRSILNDNSTCLGNILTNGDVLKNCNWERVSVMENTFHYFN